MRGVARRAWFGRSFPSGTPLEALPDIVERLRGTPARLDERVRGIAPDRTVARDGERWSIQENVGHLGDLEPLWAGRLDDFEAGRERLRDADLTNRATHEADHDAALIEDLLRRFRALRRTFVERVESMDGAVLARTAQHPRLGQPMTVVDHCLFVAEHDDHHLAAITELLGGVVQAGDLYRGRPAG